MRSESSQRIDILDDRGATHRRANAFRIKTGPAGLQARVRRMMCRRGMHRLRIDSVTVSGFEKHCSLGDA